MRFVCILFRFINGSMRYDTHRTFIGLSLVLTFYWFFHLAFIAEGAFVIQGFIQLIEIRQE